MEKYSCSYGGTADNFVLLNIESQIFNNTPKEHEYGVFCVLQNIIQRGTVTKPSCFLEENIGNIVPGSHRIHLVTNELCNWERTIKGDANNADYPAATFFNDIFPEYMGEYTFVKNLILPEAELTDILEQGSAFKGQQVDFYLPQIRTVIEIDGSSHSQLLQGEKDKIRDQALKKENIEVIRIKTFDIRNRTEKLFNKMDLIKKKMVSNNQIQEYKKSLQIDKNDLRIKYDVIIRMQMLLLSCLKSGRLKLNEPYWNIVIERNDMDDLESLIKLAYNDIIQWARSIAKLLKIELQFPEIKFNSNLEDINIKLDFSMFKHFTDEHMNNPTCIYVRNDYYNDYDYYKVSFADTLQYRFLMEGNKSDLPELKFLLKNLFGFDEFREGQLAIIMNVLERNDTIGILPTGTGKSLCYQFTSMLQPGVTIVVVPIISLMIDQKRSMDKNSMTRTSFISSQMTGEEKDKVLFDFKQGCYQFMWMSPERFQNADFRESLAEINKTMNFSLAVIDEVHCLSEWGHDFRVSYLALVRTLRNYCPEACLLGLTATASQAVLEDLKNEFENDGSGIKALSSMNRDELVFKRTIVEQSNERVQQVSQILSELDRVYGEDVTLNKGKDTRCGLIFFPTVGGYNGCINISNELNNLERIKGRIASYHGKLEGKKRIEVQSNFMDDKYPLITCTKAFGMGIDKSNIKYTIHYGLPQSIESFYQEVGRAGRDANKSEKSYCYILYTPENIHSQTIQDIFNAETGVQRRRELCKKYLKNDLSTIMFLWNINKKDIEEEYKSIRDALAELYKGNYNLRFDANRSLDNLQAALYKLSILGVVESWTIEYLSLIEGNVSIIYNGCVEKNIEKCLMDYIHKYDIEFRLDGKSNRYQKYINMLQVDEKRITQLIKILIAWGNSNILNQRLQSTYNMMELCDKTVTDEEFRRRIDYYFRYTESTIQFESVVYHPQDYDKWFDILYEMDDNSMGRGERITKEKAKNLLASLQRYLESYRYNTGLNFLSGILRLYSNNFRNSEGVERLRDSFGSIREMDEEKQEIIILETLVFAKDLDVENKDLLSELIIQYYPNRTKQIFSIIQDRFSMSIELEKSVIQLKNIVKEKIEWTI